MPFVTINDPRDSDVVLWEEENRFSRDVVTVTLSTATGDYKKGSILFRVKGTDPTAVWDIVDAAGDLSASNEYAVLMGAQVKGQPFEVRDVNPITTATATQAIVLRRMASIKEAVPKAVHLTGYGLSAGNWATLKHLLAFQNILVQDSVAAV